ncbi:MAG: CoA transferase subunit A [Anaerolineales bacterium]|nr:CoA transferase subunit A [Anaerolineales bacterium]
MVNKQVNFEVAVELVTPGCTLAVGGLTLYRRPVAFIRALIKHQRSTNNPYNLTLLALTASFESDLLVGAGLVSRIRTCYFGLEIFGLSPMFTYYANRGQVDILEETEASIALGLRATMAGIGFMPGHAWIGTDLPNLRPDVCSVIDPYSGDELIAFPAIRPDIAVVHALKADPEGNSIIGGNKAIDVELALTANTVIVTAEEIHPQLNQADIVAPFVHAVIHAPRGALPTSCHPNYALDGHAILDYTERVSDPGSFNSYLEDFLNN